MLDDTFGYLMSPHTTSSGTIIHFPLCIGETGTAFVKSLPPNEVCPYDFMLRRQNTRLNLKAFGNWLSSRSLALPVSGMLIAQTLMRHV